MLSHRGSTLEISQGMHEGKPLLILRGCCDKDSVNLLRNSLERFLRNNPTIAAIDIKNLHHADIKTNMAISKARTNYISNGGQLYILKHTEPVSKAMKIMRNNRIAGY